MTLSLPIAADLVQCADKISLDDMVDGTRLQAPYERISEGWYRMAKASLVSDGIDEECATGACPVR